MPTNLIVSDLAKRILGAAIEVHRELGPGLLESTYERCLAHEMAIQDITCRTQVALPVIYKGLQIDCGYRIDMLVEEALILELKSLDRLTVVHEAQILTYLRLARIRQGFLINFNVRLLKDGIRSFVI
jgi:GxxExxY protein